MPLPPPAELDGHGSPLGPKLWTCLGGRGPCAIRGCLQKLRESKMGLPDEGKQKMPLATWALRLFFLGQVVFGLYFPRKEYHENVYIDHRTGMPLLRIHALKGSEEEEIHFGVCSDLIIQRDGIHKNLWFQIQENTGLLFLSRSLEKDLDKIIAGGSWPATSKLIFLVLLSSQPFQGKECQITSHYNFYKLPHLAYAKVTLSVMNATVPECHSVAPSHLCFVDMDLSFQIKENRPPGPFHQLQLPSQQQPCQKVSISYKVIADESLPFHFDGNTK